MKAVQLFIAAVLCASLTATADDTLALVFRTIDGTEISFSASDLQLAVADGKLNIFKEGTSTPEQPLHSFELVQLDRMYFSGATVGLEEAMKVYGDQPATIYTVDGIFRGSFKTLNDALTQLQSGVYVIAQSGQTFKMQVK